MTLADLALREAVLKTLADAIGDDLKAVKQEMSKALEASGATQAAAVLPDGTKVGTSSLSVPRLTARVVDEAAFVGWVASHAPAETVVTVRDAYRKSLLAQLAAGGVAEVADPETGEIVHVPGVEIVTGEPKHTVRLSKDGPGRIVEASREGLLAHLDLPQLGQSGGGI